MQFFDQIAALYGLVDQAFHSIQTVVDGIAGKQRLLDPGAEQPLAHSSAGLVQHPEQGPPLLTAPQGLGKFKVGPRHRRKLHILGFIVADDGLQALHTFDLGGVQVFQKCGHGKPHQTFFVDRGGLIPIASKLVFQRDGHQAWGVALLFHQLHRAGHVLFDIAGQLTAVQHSGIHQHLAGMVAAELRDHGRHDLLPFQLGDVGRAGGNIGKTDARRVPFQKNACNVIVFVILQHTALDDSARRDHPDDIALDQSLCLGRVLHLLTDRHLVSLGDQAGHIALVAVEGHAAHGGTLFHAALLARQGQVQLPGGGQRIVKEHLVKVADAVKQDLVLILLLDVHILLHHGRQFCHNRSPFLRAMPLCFFPSVCSK